MNLRNVDDWRHRLGLIAVPLDPSFSDRFVMLNGARGNFCLDLREESDPTLQRSVAWSADVGHYVHVQKGGVSVQRWDVSLFSQPTYSAAQVRADLAGFQSFLERDEPSRDYSIVRHLTKAFGVVRSLMSESVPATSSLGAFLALVACAINGTPLGDLSTAEWGLEEADLLETSRVISNRDWDALVSSIKAGLEDLDLRPHLDYTLRHAAGQVFQEAHYIAEVNSPTQLGFGQTLPAPAKGRKATASPGVFFTPPYLARSLAEQATRANRNFPPTVTVFDPACGSGEILREAVRQLSARNFKGCVNLVGWDISSIACKMARFVLAWERQMCPPDMEIEVAVTRTDALKESTWPNDVDLALMNPPFLSYERMNTSERATIKATLGSLAHGRIDMASAFLLRAAQSVRKGGVLGSLMPASMLTGNSAKPVRAALSTDFTSLLVGRLGDQSIFTDAFVDAGLYVGQRRAENVSEGIEAPIYLWADHTRGGISSALRALRTFEGVPIKSAHFSIFRPTDPTSEDDWRPQSLDSYMLMKEYSNSPIVGNVFDVRQGVRTGLNEAFVLREEEFGKLPRREQAFFRPALVNASIRGGRIVSNVFVFYPYGAHDIKSESELKSLAPKYFQRMLAPCKAELASRARIDKSRWWKLTWPRLRDIEPKIVSTAFGQAGSFAFDKRGDYQVLNGFCWYLRGKKRVQANSDRFGYAYLAILNNPIIDDLLPAVSRRLAGGQWDLQNKFVNRLPVPDLFSMAVPADLIDQLAKIGALIAGGKIEQVDAAEWREIVTSAYSPIGKGQ